MFRKVFEDKDFSKKLFSLVIPIALQQLMLAAVSASDAVTQCKRKCCKT